MVKLWSRTAGFVQRQPSDFKLMLVRRSIHALAINLSAQYNSIYATALGASPVQLGSLSSAGNAIAALISLPAGWLIDRYSLKKVFLSGTALMAVSTDSTPPFLGSTLLPWLPKRGANWGMNRAVFSRKRPSASV